MVGNVKPPVPPNIDPAVYDDAWTYLTAAASLFPIPQEVKLLYTFAPFADASSADLSCPGQFRLNLSSLAYNVIAKNNVAPPPPPLTVPSEYATVIVQVSYQQVAPPSIIHIYLQINNQEITFISPSFGVGVNGATIFESSLINDMIAGLPLATDTAVVQCAFLGTPGIDFDAAPKSVALNYVAPDIALLP